MAFAAVVAELPLPSELPYHPSRQPCPALASSEKKAVANSFRTPSAILVDALPGTFVVFSLL
jgi:hypothetical protein